MSLHCTELTVPEVLVCSNPTCCAYQQTPESVVGKSFITSGIARVDSRNANAAVSAAQFVLQISSIRWKVRTNIELEAKKGRAVRQPLPFVLDVVDSKHFLFSASPQHEPVRLNLLEAESFLCVLQHWICTFFGAERAPDQLLLGTCQQDLIRYRSPPDAKAEQLLTNAPYTVQLAGFPGGELSSKQHTLDPRALLDFSDPTLSVLLQVYPTAVALFSDDSQLFPRPRFPDSCKVRGCSEPDGALLGLQFCNKHREVVKTEWKGAHSGAPLGRTSNGILCCNLPDIAGAWVSLAHCPKCRTPLFGAGGYPAPAVPSLCVNCVASKATNAADHIDEKPHHQTLASVLFLQTFTIIFEEITRLQIESINPVEGCETIALPVEPKSVTFSEVSLSQMQKKPRRSAHKSVDGKVLRKLVRVLELLEFKMADKIGGLRGPELEERMRSQVCDEFQFGVDLQIADLRATMNLSALQIAEYNWVVAAIFPSVFKEAASLIEILPDFKDALLKDYDVPEELLEGNLGLGVAILRSVDDLQIRDAVVRLGAAREMARDSTTLESAHAAHSARTQALNAVATRMVDTPDILCFEDGLRTAIMVHEVLGTTAEILTTEAALQSVETPKNPRIAIMGNNDNSTKLLLHMKEATSMVSSHLTARPPSQTHIQSITEAHRMMALEDCAETRNQQRAVVAPGAPGSSIAQIRQLSMSCRQDQLTLQEYGEESEALRLALRLRDEARYGIYAGTVSAMVELEELLQQAGWLYRARRAGAIVRVSDGPANLARLAKRLESNRSMSYPTDRKYLLALLATFKNQTGQFRAAPGISSEQLISMSNRPRSLWPIPAPEHFVNGRPSLSSKIIDNLESPSWARQLQQQLNGCLSLIHLDLSEHILPKTNDEKAVEYIQHALRNPHRLDLCELVKGDTLGSWRLMNDVNPDCLPFCKDGRLLGLCWHQRTDRRGKPTSVSQAEAVSVRRRLLYYGIDPRLYSTHGPQYCGPLARLLLTLNAFASRQDFLIKLDLATNIDWRSSVTTDGTLALLSTEHCNQHPLGSPLPASLFAPLTGTGISTADLAVLDDARYLAALPLSGTSTLPQHVLAAHAMNGDARELEEYVTINLMHCNTRIPPILGAQDYSRALIGRDAVVKSGPSAGIRVYTRQDPGMLPPGYLKEVLNSAVGKVDPCERYRFQYSREGTQHSNPAVSDEFRPYACLSLLYPDIFNSVFAEQTKALRRGVRVLHVVFENKLHVIDLTSCSPPQRVMFDSIAHRLFHRAIQSTSLLMAWEALTIAELCFFPCNSSTDSRFAALSAWTCQERKALGCLADLEHSGHCKCPQLPSSWHNAYTDNTLIDAVLDACPHITYTMEGLMKTTKI